MRGLSVTFLMLVLAGCSWFSDKEGGPMKLEPLRSAVDVKSRWEVSIGAGAGKYYRLISPVIEGDTVYANDYKGRVYAVDRDSGQTRWQQDLKIDVASGVGVGGGQVFIGSLDGDVVALDSVTGEEQWRVNIVSEILSPPQTNGAVAVVQTNDGKLLGLDVKSGKTLWSYSAQLPILTLRGTATPVVLGPNVVTGFANGKLAALSAVDGTLYWERRIARPRGRSDIERVVDIDGSPVIDGQNIYASSYNGTLSALSPRGQILWSVPASSYSSPVVIDGRVYVTTATGSVRAFDSNTGDALWEYGDLARRKLSAPQNLAGFLVTADYEGYVHVLDPETGVMLDRFRVDKDGVRSPMISDGTYLYVMGNDGELASLAVYLRAP